MKTSYETENELLERNDADGECVIDDEIQSSECMSVDVSQTDVINADIECASSYFALVSSLCVQRSMGVISEADADPETPNEDVCQSLPTFPTVPPRVPKRVMNTEEPVPNPVINAQGTVHSSTADPEEIINSASLSAEEIIHLAAANVEEEINRASVFPEEVLHRASVILEEVSHRRSANLEEVVQIPLDLETFIDNLRAEVPREIWSDTISQVPAADDETVTSDTDVGAAHCEPTSEMYYTASSEISLVSDEMPDRLHEEDSKEKKECVTAGHVAAMRERFESMTRTNTPDFLRSSSPSLDVMRNITPSPDRLG